MANTSMNIRMDSEVKKQAEALFGEIGMTMTTAINIFLKQSIRENGIPFELKVNTPNAETLAAIDDVNNNRNMSKAYDDMDELMRDLNA